MRWDSAAIVPNTRELFPEPDTPVNTVSRRLGISTLTSLRLFSRAPWTRIRSWLSAGCWPDRLMGSSRVVIRRPGRALTKVAPRRGAGRSVPHHFRLGDQVGALLLEGRAGRRLLERVAAARLAHDRGPGQR